MALCNIGCNGNQTMTAGVLLSSGDRDTFPCDSRRSSTLALSLRLTDRTVTGLEAVEALVGGETRGMECRRGGTDLTSRLAICSRSSSLVWAKVMALVSWYFLKQATLTIVAERTQKVKATERVMIKYNLHSDSCSGLRPS